MAMTSHGTFIGPDNGLLSWAVRAAGPIRWIALENPSYRIAKVGVTFDGRDLFAPTAAYLARGVDPADLGPEIDDPIQLPWPGPRLSRELIEGEILVVDAFGNLITNIPVATAKTTLGSDALLAHIPGGPDAPLSGSYAAITGELGLVANGSGLLEVAAFQHSAADLTGLGRGAQVTVTAGGRLK
jgi:S-adenosylmethionine hydrolase